MEFLYFLESIRNPVLDFIMSTITFIGGEAVFLAIAIVLIWCVNKRNGYFTLLTCFFGIVINQVLKLVFRIPRPWVRDPDFTIVESAREEATGYSFPSGHTQNVTGTFASVALAKPKRAWVISCSVIIALVAFSRMYLGVHTPLDVGVSLAIGVALAFALRPLFVSEERMKRVMPYVLVASVLITVGFVLFTFLLPAEGLDPHNLDSGRKNACTMIGCVAGLILVYFVDNRYIKYPTSARWYAQLMKVGIGFAIVLLIKSTLQTPLEWVFGGNMYIARSVRYFLLVAFAGCVWTLTFRFWSNLKIECLDRFGERVLGYMRKIFAKKSAAVTAGEGEESVQNAENGENKGF